MTTNRKAPAVGTPAQRKTPSPFGSMPIPGTAQGILTSTVFSSNHDPWTVPTLLAEISKGDALTRKALAVLSRRCERTGTIYQEPSSLIRVWGFQGIRFLSLSTGDWFRVSQTNRVTYLEQDKLPNELQSLSNQ